MNTDRLCSLVVRVPGYKSRGPGFDSLCYQIFGEIVGLERGSFSLVSTTEELLGKKSSGSCPENREYGRRDPLRWPRDTLYPQTLALTSATSSGRSVGIVRPRTKATEFFSSICNSMFIYCLLKEFSCEYTFSSNRHINCSLITQDRNSLFLHEVPCLLHASLLVVGEFVESKCQRRTV
jgi:hypothetical protein